MANILQFPSVDPPVQEPVYEQAVLDRVTNFVRWRPHAQALDIAEYLEMDLTEVLLILLYLVEKRSLRMVQNS